MELLFGPYICGSDGVSDHQTVSMNVGSEINCIWSQQQAAGSVCYPVEAGKESEVLRL